MLFSCYICFFITVRCRFWLYIIILNADGKKSLTNYNVNPLFLKQMKMSMS